MTSWPTRWDRAQPHDEWHDTSSSSPRGETEVLALVASGMTNIQIGRALFVSEATVKTHLSRACAKLGVTGRAAAVAKAMQTGALPPPGRPS
jgi:DNA-binding CsgD family transcriptional regulator